MEQYSGDFLAAVDGLRALLGCSGHVWPVSTERATLCAAYRDGTPTRGEARGRRGAARRHRSSSASGSSRRADPSGRRRGHRRLDAIIIGPGSFYTSLMPTLPRRAACARRVAAVRGPVIYIANLLTEGGGMRAFTAGAGAALDRAPDRTAGGRHRRQPGPAGHRVPSPATRPRTSIRCRSARSSAAATSSRRRSGRASTPATIAAASPMPSGASWRSGSCL